MSTVLIHNATYENVRYAVERVFEIFPLDLRGKKVLIKPNVLRASRAEEGIVTHPAVLRAVVEKIEAMNPASMVVGDNPGMFNYGENEECFRKTGLMEAAKGYYRNIGIDTVRMDFDPLFMDHVHVSRILKDADIVISLPKFKTHGLTVISGAVKNSYGILPGAQKARLHKAAGSPERFHEVLVEVFRLRIPDLFIIDAVVGMEGNGPASPDLREIGLIMASDNAVSLDAVMAVMAGCDPSRLRFLQKAKEEGLGDYDLDEIEIIGELKPLPDFKLPPLGGDAVHRSAASQALIRDRMLVRPHVEQGLCTGCGSCIDRCPASALFMNNGLPAVNDEMCVTCFCCQEICPQKAIALR